jgi:hypothetical protein
MQNQSETNQEEKGKVVQMPLPGAEANPEQQQEIKKAIGDGKLFMKMDVSVLNQIIKSITNIDKGAISDGFHTFADLYNHRNELFIALCRAMMPVGTGLKPWRTKKHSDGSPAGGVPVDQWFILGLGKEEGKQMTYHLPIAKWDACEFAETLEQAPEFDFHTPQIVLDRLKEVAKQ